MKSIYFDCYAGISGDMTVAALLDLGVPLEYLRAELDKLHLPAGAFSIESRPTVRKGLAALAFYVIVHERDCHRHYGDIHTLIADSSLSDPVKERAQRVFHRLARAEALVHGVAIEQVHFHEVGALDSIVDIVGTAICLDYLDVELIHTAPLPLGGGFVETAHGRLPVPAPATAELMRGLAVHGECGKGERVTPTGAAILAALAASGGCQAQPDMMITGIGCGAGSKDFDDVPNILRVFLGTRESGGANRVMVVETNIDDSTPQVLGYAMERLFEAGALDVFFTSIQMKKNRPATQLTFLCRPEQLDALALLVLSETSAIGIRYYPVSRTTLLRSIEERQTPFGPLRFKMVHDSGRLLRSAPEYEDCRRIARERGIPLQDVLRMAARCGDFRERGA